MFALSAIAYAIRVTLARNGRRRQALMAAIGKSVGAQASSRAGHGLE
jgi:hypothetical protein